MIAGTHRKKCRYYGRSFGQKTSTSNLKSHLTLKHPNLFRSHASSGRVFDQDVAEVLLAKAIAHSGLSYRLVEDPEFRNFLAHLQPRFSPPDRNKVSKILIPFLCTSVSHFFPF
jgi:hypothetical protein